MLELSCIVVAAAAGMRLGWSFVEPGRLTGGQALRREAHKTAAIVAGTAPWLVLAGLVEGFITPSGLSLAEALDDRRGARRDLLDAGDRARPAEPACARIGRRWGRFRCDRHPNSAPSTARDRRRRSRTHRRPECGDLPTPGQTISPSRATLAQPGGSSTPRPRTESNGRSATTGSPVWPMGGRSGDSASRVNQTAAAPRSATASAYLGPRPRLRRGGGRRPPDRGRRPRTLQRDRRDDSGQRRFATNPHPGRIPPRQHRR